MTQCNPLMQLDILLPSLLLADPMKYFSIICQIFKKHFYFRQDEPLNSHDKIQGGEKAKHKQFLLCGSNTVGILSLIHI